MSDDSDSYSSWSDERLKREYRRTPPDLLSKRFQIALEVHARAEKQGRDYYEFLGEDVSKVVEQRLRELREEDGHPENKSPLERFMDGVKEVVKATGREEVELSCDSDRFIPGEGVMVTEIYEHLGRVVRLEGCHYDTVPDANRECIDDMFENIQNFVAPCVIELIGNKAIITKPEIRKDIGRVASFHQNN